MKLVKGKPPIYDSLVRAGLEPTEKTVFTYGDSLYIQDIDEKEITPLLIAHEEVHTKQQGHDIDFWWDKYVSNPQFRYEQELEAYATQYKKIIEIGVKDNIKKWFLNIFARDLASPVYGSLISVLDAESKIRNKAKYV